MTPTPQEHAQPSDTIPTQHDGNRIVISGMSGLYPQSNNVKEFSDILYKKVNPITQHDIRYKYNHPEVVQYAGSVPGLCYFDAQFFKVNHRLAMNTDPMSRKILEQTYQAIYDAGINPGQLSGRKVGVFVGSCYSESEKTAFYKVGARSGLGIAGCNKAMFANRISYWLNAKGPSMAIDEACCSSTAALEQAYLALSRGECEAAIVGGSYLCMHPQSSVHYGRIIKLCSDGKTKSFDERADGCVKSEAINVLFLQKAKDAMRVYAEVLHVKTEFTCVLKEETGPKYGFDRDLDSTTNFMKNFYKQAGVPPHVVQYVEAFGSAAPDADKVELQTIEDVFCQNRDDPLFIGSVMSNIGYGEAASGISAITKVLLGYHNGQLAANLHSEHPRKDIAALCDGRMRIVTEHQHFDRTYVAVNGMSVTGTNSHVLLHGCYKAKDLNRYATSMPYLVTLSGRHEEAVTHMIEVLKSNPIDPEQLALIHNIHRMNISGHLGRGYTILRTNDEQQTVSVCEKASYCDNARRPLWFVYSGMGSQWTGMGKQLMRIPMFAAAIERCRKALEPKGLDIVHIITSDDETTFNNILHSFVGIAAIQIGLTDILHELGFNPDGIIGHSVGELVCAYADGCLTAEQVILSAYYRGLVSVETKFIHGSMAAVGLGFEKVSKLCPPEIAVACHNGPEASTISGPSDVMHEFITTLSAKGIFAKEVPCSNIAYHSRYIADAGPGLLKYLNGAIPTPKARSKRWLSTSVPQDKWDEPFAKLCSAEYLTYNLLNPVLFEETSRLLPNDAVLVEIAPHGLLQAILKRSMPSTCKNIPLTRRKHPDNTVMLLEAIGTLYMEGYNCNVQVLYPKIEMPVSTGTPFLSHFVKWVHDEIWPLSLYQSADRKYGASSELILSIHDREHAYLKGHTIRGKRLYPFAASLTLVWDVLAMTINKPKKELSVVFSKLQLHSQPVLNEQQPLKLFVAIHRGTGQFEVLNDNSIVISGYIRAKYDTFINKYAITDDHQQYLNTEDIYRMFRDRDYFYSGEFQSIASIDESLSSAKLVWRGNWITFIDSLLQLNVLRQSYNAVSQPTIIRRITIDIKQHRTDVLYSNKSDGIILIDAIVDEYDNIRCGGVLMESIQFQHLPPFNSNAMTLKSLQFSHLNSGLNVSVNRKIMESQTVTLQSSQIGEYDSLKWVNVPDLTGTGVPVNVHYAGINNNDLKYVNGSLLFKNNNNIGYGMDFSGTTESGSRVMGIVHSGAASSKVKVQPELLWPVPPHWSLEEAATVPLAYVQAFYCLVIKVELSQGRVVFVHGGAGALGQAIISILLTLDCEIFTTVSDMHKKRFLQNLYPSLKADHIGCSRDHTFREMIIARRKCDIVINCVKGALKDLTIQCINFSGYFLDISQLQNRDDYKFGMYHLTQQRNYVSIEFSSIFEDKNFADLKKIHKMISHGITCGHVRPLSHVTYAPSDIARAFRLLATSSHRGRVLICMKEDIVQAQCSFSCRADRSNVIICGKTEFGSQLADRLVSRGAKQLYMHVPTQSSYLVQKIRLWKKSGVKVIMSSESLISQKAVASFLNNSLNLGPLEGVYVVVEGTNVDDDWISNVDTELRKMHTHLRSMLSADGRCDTDVDRRVAAVNKVIGAFSQVVKRQSIVEEGRLAIHNAVYFAVINLGDNTIGKNICVNRVKEQLPATLFILPEIEVETYSSYLNWRCALDALEHALNSEQDAIVAHENKHIPSLMQQIAKFVGLQVLDDTANSTLEELGIQNHKLQPLSTFLRVHYNLAFSEEQILSLTIKKINDLEKKVNELPYEDIKGLSKFFNYIDSDELQATTELVFLPTLVNNVSMRDDEIQPHQIKLCIVPGMEGHHKKFRILCERLKIAALVLQPGLDHLEETVIETAQRFAEVLLKKTEMKNTFYLLGYETGIYVALELAAILEDHGLSGKVFCLGCTPEEFEKDLEKQLSSFENEQQLQDEVLRHMYSLMTGSDTKFLDHLLQNLTTWSGKIDVCVRSLLDRVSHSAQYARSLIESVFARINQMRHYSVALRPLRSQIILLRAANGNVPLQDTILQHTSQQPLVVHQLNSFLAHVTKDLHCSAIINEHLDPEILEKFETRNICNTYLLNPTSFIGFN